MIRQAIGLYLDGVRDRYGAEGLGGDSQPDMPSAAGTLAVTLLLPMSRVAELEALAAQRQTTASALIRRVICCSLLGRSPVQKLAEQ